MSSSPSSPDISTRSNSTSTSTAAMSPPPSAALPFASLTTMPATASTSKSQPGMAAAADTPTISGLSTPPTSPPICSLGSTRSSSLLPAAQAAPPAAEGQQQLHAAVPSLPTRPAHQRYATHDIAQSTTHAPSSLSSSLSAAAAASARSSASVDRAVRALMAELDASIFRNVSSAVSAFFLDVIDVGHFVSMPHIGACASPEANYIMRSIEETLTRHAGYLLDPTDRGGLEAFGDALAGRVGSDPRVLTPLAKVLIVLRLGHTATAARQSNHPAVAAMVPEFPLFLDAHVQIQAHKVGSATFASTSAARSSTAGGTPDEALAQIAEDAMGGAHAGLHRSASLHTSPSAAAHAHFASPPVSPAPTALAFTTGSLSRPSTAPTAPAPALVVAPAPRPPPVGPMGARKRTVSLPATSAPSAHAAAAASAASRPKTEVAVVLESMVADARSTSGGMRRHPVYLLHVQDAAAAAAAASTGGFGSGATPRGGSPAGGGAGAAFMP